MARKYTNKEWLGFVKEFRETNLTQTEFVKKKGLKLAAFKYWLYRPSREKNVVNLEAGVCDFVEVLEGVSSPKESFRLRMGAVFSAGGPLRWMAVGPRLARLFGFHLVQPELMYLSSQSESEKQGPTSLRRKKPRGPSDFAWARLRHSSALVT